MPLTYDLSERIAAIEADPLLSALSSIADLGSCGGRGGLQKAVDIAGDAIEAHFRDRAVAIDPTPPPA